MSERQGSPYDDIARKWLALAERRQADFIVLLESGRWRHYFTESELREETRKIASVRVRWTRVVELLSGERLGERSGTAKSEELLRGDGGLAVFFERAA